MRLRLQGGRDFCHVQDAAAPAAAGRRRRSLWENPAPPAKGPTFCTDKGTRLGKGIIRRSLGGLLPCADCEPNVAEVVDVGLLGIHSWAPAHKTLKVSSIQTLLDVIGYSAVLAVGIAYNRSCR